MGHSSRAGHNPPDGLLITVLPHLCLLPACDPSSLRHTAPLPGPSWPAKNHTGRDLLQREGNKKCCPCHKAKLPLTLQTFSRSISSSVETSSHCHTLVGHSGYKSAPSSMVRGFSQEFPGQQSHQRPEPCFNLFNCTPQHPSSLYQY